MDQAIVYKFPDNNKKLWSSFACAVKSDYESFSAYIRNSMSEDEAMELLQKMLVSVGQNGFLTNERKLKLFTDSEKMGIHIMPTHFYSPVPSVKELTESDFSPYTYDGLSLNETSQWELLQSFSPYFQELSDIHDEKQNDHEYYFNNPALCGIDAMIYYAMIRHYKPSRIIEVGAGNSTKIAARAASLNDSTELYAIEPYPSDCLRNGYPGLTKLIPSKIQDIDLTVFDQLEENDILFIDNSHVSKIGSDVNHVLLRILPRLKPGVIIHFHDIFIPFEYPEDWVKEKQIFWNEQYLLHSFMMYNSDFEIMLANYFLSQIDLDKLKQLVPFSPHHIGGSFWIRRV